MPGVDTTIIPPHGALRPFVRFFAIREIDTDDKELLKPMIADHEMTMAFFLRSNIQSFKPVDNLPPMHSIDRNGDPECYFIGPQSFTKGFAVFKGKTTLLNIHFQPSGFRAMFNIRVQECLDKIGHCIEILTRDIAELHEQMLNLPSVAESITLLEHYLMRKLALRLGKNISNSIVNASAFLLRHSHYPITRLAADCNMTLQTFEVRFADQVGFCPKIFSRLVRFNQAVNLKTYSPTMHWTKIAHGLGYYDQNHLIKEFKDFTSLSPNKFIAKINPVYEVFRSEAKD